MFDALFEHESFAAHNPVSISMQTMVDALADHGLDAETVKLAKFYDSVRRRAEFIETSAGRQSVIHELYEQFFKKAFPKQASSLGVVYTPVEIVDFILRATDEVCRREFGYGLTDEGVHVLDPFTGTGTFIVRLLESGIIRPEHLARKYASELWANEIMLLAYYIACVNIETTYQSVLKVQQPESDVPYRPFPGATLTDTFQITEHGDRADTSLIPVNSDRIEAQLATPIKVIIGNPPYSVGQDSANDNNANFKYPTLDARIRATYAVDRNRGGGQSIFDSYIRALRWASDRVDGQGVIAFVTNNGWVDGSSADGLRKSFASEFQQIWIYNLRGNARSAGDIRRREGGGVFDSGARTGVTIVIAVKGAAAEQTLSLQYHAVPDFQSREEKLADLSSVSNLESVQWEQLTPNEHGDWINQRSQAFDDLLPLGTKAVEERGDLTVFSTYSRGLETGRDAWIYNSSKGRLLDGLKSTISAYNDQCSSFARFVNENSRLPPKALVDDFIDRDPRKIKWTLSLKNRLTAGRHVEFFQSGLRVAHYRPYYKQHAYFDRALNHIVGQLPRFFPTEHHQNAGIYVVGASSDKPFSALMTDVMPDLAMWGSSSGQYFPRWTYERTSDKEQESLLMASGEVDGLGYRRVDNITDGSLVLYQNKLGAHLTKDDIFHYVYGVLHSEQYRTTFAADLKRMLPRMPLAASISDFEAFAEAGRRLANLHIDYESVEPYPLHEQTAMGIDNWELYQVTKMRWADKTSKKAITYNGHVTLSDIPAEAHRYMLGSRSALEWLIDRYQVTADKASGIVNDPNDWCRQHDDPRYIVDLIKRVTRVSVETMRIVDSLPELPV